MEFFFFSYQLRDSNGRSGGEANGEGKSRTARRDKEEVDVVRGSGQVQRDVGDLNRHVDL